LADAEPDSGQCGSIETAVNVAIVSDIGMRRQNNQDSYSLLIADSLERWRNGGHLFVVADGMGAHAAGEKASKMAVDRIPHHYAKLDRLIPAEALVRAVVESNSEIFRSGQINPEFRSMGTTASVLAILPEGAVVAHVGDSRVYRLRGTVFEQLTFDHSLVWEMLASGGVSEETVKSGAIPKNVITRSLGPNPSVQIDLEGPFPIQVSDKFLLCSDGLTGQVSDDELSVLLQVLPLKTACEVMVDLANLRGGPDNTTVILVEAVGSELVTTNVRQPDSSKRSEADVVKPFSPALGAVTVICLLAAGVLAWLGQTPLAIVTLVLGIIALVTGLVQMNAWRINSEQSRDHYGRGPHRTYKAVPNQAFVDKLAGTIAALRDAAQQNRWPVDWAFLDSQSESGRAAESKQDWPSAVKIYSAAVQHIMQAVKNRREDAGGSSISL
jgi:protein phosphatase